MKASSNFFEQNNKAKPFIKWAGGKSQLVDRLEAILPKHILESKEIETYVEPFVGGGAFFFHLKNNYHIRKSYLFDLNKDLIIGYKVIQKDHYKLIKKLKELENTYLANDDLERKELFYEIRNFYNQQINHFNYEHYTKEWVDRASYLIFLNRTCYNGLFRQNKKGEFNVPYGKYKNPTICNEVNIEKVHFALIGVEVSCIDFTESRRHIKEGSLVYFDPPYRPLTNTSSFTSYSKKEFNDKDQIRLADFFKDMDKRKAYLILSNSDPKNEDPNDTFFDKLYKDYTIQRVNAKRSINCNPYGRGKIKELIITNYNVANI